MWGTHAFHGAWKPSWGWARLCDLGRVPEREVVLGTVGGGCRGRHLK